MTKRKSVLLTLLLVASTAFAQDSTKVNINTATLELLRTLKGIGKVKSKSVIAHRDSMAFVVPEDFKKVKGIGVKTYEKNKHRIVVK